MGRIQIYSGLRLLLDDQLHIVRDILPDATYRLENLHFGGWITLDAATLSNQWAQGKGRFEISGPGVRPGETPGLAVSYTRADFEALPPHQRDAAWERYRLLDALFRSAQQSYWTSLSRQAIQTFLEQQAATVSVYTLERWLRAFLASGGDIRSLVPLTDQRGGKGQSRLQPEVEHIVQSTLASCQRQSESGVAVGPRPTRLLERVEIDHTPLHLFVVDLEDRLPIGRPTLTLATDTYSKMPFGFDVSFQPGSYLTAMRCLRHGILPKPDCQTLYGTTHPFPVYGLPETVVVDRGMEFVGNSLVDALGMLGIIHEVMPGRTPWYKGSIERFFRTQNQGLLEGLPGYTFGDIFSRADYDPVQDACISLETFHKLLHIFLLDIYAQRWHDGIQDIPARRWEQGCQSGLAPTLYHDAEELRILLCASDTRTLTRQGITWETLHYNSSALSQLRQRTGGGSVRFRYDPEDLGEIHVFDPDVGWLTVPAVHPEYASGLSLYKHRVIRRALLADKRASVDIYALAQARLRLQELVTQEFARTRRQRGRKHTARLLEAPAVASPPPQRTNPQPPLLDIPLPDHLDDSGWGADYNLPPTPKERNDHDR